MDLLKQLTGKNPAEYENVSKILINTPDVDLFAKLVKQDDFLFDFIKNNVANRIKSAVNKDNYRNILSFWKYYSTSYDSVFADLLWLYGGESIIGEIKDIFRNGETSEKCYAAKFLSLVPNENLTDIVEIIREYSQSKDEFLANNCIELLAKLGDEESKTKALEKLDSDDEFTAYEGVKFLVTYGAKDALDKILTVMKKSSLSENIACEIPYLIPIDELLDLDFESAVLVLCNIVVAIPEIAQPSVVLDYNLLEIFENLYKEDLSPSVALLLRLAKDKFYSLEENDEYLFDCDKNTKDEISGINKFLRTIKTNRLNSLLYEELYDESDFVFFAIDFVEDKEELETLLDSKNQTLVMKVLNILKEKQMLSASHKEIALNSISNPELRRIVEVL